MGFQHQSHRNSLLSTLSIFWSTLFVTVLICSQTESLAVMSIDLGSEWVKIGVVSPGVPMEIVLNKESKRKTPIAISFRDGERVIGEDALNVAVKFPANAYLYFTDLLGKQVDNPMVKLFQKRFPYYTIVPDEDRGTVLFQHDSDTRYSPEELLGMLLSKCREYAQDFTRQPIKDAVITVPPFFNQAERRAVLNAAELADIKVLQLMNSNTAVALNYGIFRRNDFNETPQNILLYDMGASSTVASVISYQIVKTKEKGFVETNPQLNILGVGYDRTLGGLELQLRLRDYLAKKFNEMKKTKTDVFTNHRAMAKLFKEAGRLKNVLSANSGHNAQVEGLLDDKDFKQPVTREEFESLFADMMFRVTKPIEQALSNAGLSMDLIDQVILVGAGTRVPKVQEKLSEFLKRELGKSLNTDEAAALGAVYKGADLSNGFKVKKFITKDAVLFPILVDFAREIEGDDGTKTLKIIRRTLFSHMNPFPQKKILTFNKHVNDFTFYVSYGDLQVSKEEAQAVGSSNITKVELSGVGTAHQKHSTTDGVEPKGVKAHFSMDDSGIFSLSLVESIFEKNSTEPETSDASDTLSKIGSAFSSLFGNTDPIPEPTKPEEGENIPDNAADNETNNTAEGDSTAPKTNGEESPKEETAKQTNETKKNVTAETTAKKPKLITIKEAVESTTHILDVVPLDGEKFKVSAKKLKDLSEADRVRGLTEKSRNSLEGFVLEMQDKVHSPEYERYVTEEEREKIGRTCSEISDWLYEDGAHASKEIYDEKFKSLKILSKDLSDRIREHKERPDAILALDKMLNISVGFLESSKSVPEDQQYFTEVELKTLDKLVSETIEWRNKLVAQQDSGPQNVAPVLTVRMIADKIDSLDREVKYMLNKARVEKLKKQREAAEQLKEKERQTDATSDDKNKTVPDTSSEPPPTENEDNKVESEESTTEKKNKTDEEEVDATKSTRDQDGHTEL